MMPFVVATTAERAGVLIGAATIVAWLVYVVITFRLRDPDTAPGAEIELAPNRRPYFDDDTLEGKRLTKALIWAMVLLVVAGVGPLVYWLNEPSRQAGAIDEFDQKAMNRGRSLFQPTDSAEHGAHFGCAKCHGPEGAGGSTTFTITDFLGATRQVTWTAPPVDTALLKFSPDEVRKILVYGRANTPMPAWGVAGGGPMNDQQIDDLVAYLGSIVLTPKQAQARAVKDAENQAAEDGTSPTDGATLFRTNCARCHTKGWSFGEPEVMGGGAFGPNLTNGATLRQFPDLEAMIAFISEGSEYGKPYGTRGQGGDEGGGMPGFRVQGTADDGSVIHKEILTPEQVRAIVEYERSL